MATKQRERTSSDTRARVRFDVDVEVFEEGRQTDDGADDGRVVAIRQGPKGHEEDDQEIVFVDRSHCAWNMLSLGMNGFGQSPPCNGLQDLATPSFMSAL